MKVIGEENVGVKWCFRCREYVRFTDRCMATVEPSYYDPHWERRCEKGHIDGDLFPGYSREYS